MSSAPGDSSSFDAAPRSPRWKWGVCGLLLLATMLLYMDRQTLALTIIDIRRDIGINNEQYGQLEFGFGIAFAVGAIFFGILVDRFPIRWLYPFVLTCWSCAGLATAFAVDIGDALATFLTPIFGDPGQWLIGFTGLSDEQRTWSPEKQGSLSRGFLGFWSCRVSLGFFEAGHWPCALVTTQRILAHRELPLGNSILQSGASLGAILTPIVVLLLSPVSVQPNQPSFADAIWELCTFPSRPDVAAEIASDAWRAPFVVVGLVGLSWLIPWFLLIGKRDLEYRPMVRTAAEGGEPSTALLVRKFLACIIIVVMINLMWQFYRAWLPKLMGEHHGYSKLAMGIFISMYYIMSDIGCIGAGAMVRKLAGVGWDVHKARVFTFAACTGLTSLSFVIAETPPGPWLVLMLFLVAAGSLGLFPNYYAFSQDLSRRHQGKITGTLGFFSWVASAAMQGYVGKDLEANKDYRLAITLAGAAPLIALAALLILWRPGRKQSMPI